MLVPPFGLAPPSPGNPGSAAGSIGDVYEQIALKIALKQECIPLEWVPPASVTVSGGVYPEGVCPGGSAQGGLYKPHPLLAGIHTPL